MLNPGTILQNRYQIIRQLGAGGMGAVYLAYDLHLQNRQVVVKENLGGDPQLFYAEANILAALHHPNLPRVIDHFIEASSTAAQPGAQYLVMDYIAGQTLEQVVQARGMLTEQDALAWMFQVMDAVRYLHTNRIIHRDIKPQNIIITPDGRAVLVDFGIAKVMQPGRATVTAARGFGSPGYASPEHYTGGTDERSDVYALGATLYFALTGIEPPSVPERAGGVSLVSICQRNASVSAKTEIATLKALELRKDQRFQNVPEMELAMRAMVAPTIPVRTPSNRLLAGISVVIVALVVLSLVAVIVTQGMSKPTLTFVALATSTRAPVTFTLVPALPTATLVVIIVTAIPVPPTDTPMVATTLRYTPTPNPKDMLLSAFSSAFTKIKAYRVQIPEEGRYIEVTLPDRFYQSRPDEVVKIGGTLYTFDANKQVRVLNEGSGSYMDRASLLWFRDQFTQSSQITLLGPATIGATPCIAYSATFTVTRVVPPKTPSSTPEITRLDQLVKIYFSVSDSFPIRIEMGPPAPLTIIFYDFNAVIKPIEPLK